MRSVGVAFTLLSILCVLIAFLLAKPEKWHGAGGASLIGEERITDAASARNLAERMVLEATDIWAQPSSQWATVSEGDKGLAFGGAADARSGALLTEAIRIDHGDFARSGVLLTRARGVITDASADATIRHLVSAEGFAIIDPMSDPTDFAKYHEKFPWRGGARLEVADAHAAIPGFAPREFSVLNAIDVKSGVFVSKSILHASKPGGSEFNAHGLPPPPNGTVRALNTFAVRATPLGANSCSVEMINFAHLGGSFPWSVTNLINGGFLNGVYERLQTAMSSIGA